MPSSRPPASYTGDVPPRLGQPAAREQSLGVALGRRADALGDVGEHPAWRRRPALAALPQLSGQLRRGAQPALNGVRDQLGDLGRGVQAPCPVEACAEAGVSGTPSARAAAAVASSARRSRTRPTVAAAPRVRAGGPSAPDRARGAPRGDGTPPGRSRTRPGRRRSAPRRSPACRVAGPLPSRTTPGSRRRHRPPSWHRRAIVGPGTPSPRAPPRGSRRRGPSAATPPGRSPIVHVAWPDGDPPG